MNRWKTLVRPKPTGKNFTIVVGKKNQREISIADALEATESRGANSIFPFLSISNTAEIVCDPYRIRFH